MCVVLRLLFVFYLGNESITALLSIRNLLSGLDSHEKDTGNKEDHGNDEQDNRWGDFVFHKKSFRDGGSGNSVFSLIQGNRQNFLPTCISMSYVIFHKFIYLIYDNTHLYNRDKKLLAASVYFWCFMRYSGIIDVIE